MINKKDLTAFTNKFARRQRGLRDPQIMHPEREWFAGLGVALLIFLSSAYASAYTYVKNKHTEVFQVEPEQNVNAIYKESLVKDALERFDARTNNLDALLLEIESKQPSPSTAPLEEGTDLSETEEGSDVDRAVVTDAEQSTTTPISE